MLCRMLSSNESTSVKTAMMAKIPTVTPSKESKVLSKLALRAPRANKVLSKKRIRVFFKSLRKIKSTSVRSISARMNLKDIQSLLKGWN